MGIAAEGEDKWSAVQVRSQGGAKSAYTREFGGVDVSITVVPSWVADWLRALSKRTRGGTGHLVVRNRMVAQYLVYHVGHRMRMSRA